MDNQRSGRVRRSFLAVLLIIFCAVSVSGCASFRKKFIRQSKQEKNDQFLPVLEPVEYPRVVSSPMDQYKNHYGLAKAYLKDVQDVVGARDSGDKQQRYVLSQVGSRFDQMAALLSDGEKKSLLMQLSFQVQDLVKEYDKAGPMRRYDLMKMTMRRVEHDFRKSFKPELVKEDLKP